MSDIEKHVGRILAEICLGDLSLRQGEELAWLLLDRLADDGYVIVPREPTDEIRIASVEGMHAGLEPFIRRLRDDGQDDYALLLSTISSSAITDSIWRAMIDAALSPPGKPSADPRVTE